MNDFSFEVNANRAIYEKETFETRRYAHGLLNKRIKELEQQLNDINTELFALNHVICEKDINTHFVGVDNKVKLFYSLWDALHENPLTHDEYKRLNTYVHEVAVKFDINKDARFLKLDMIRPYRAWGDGYYQISSVVADKLEEMKKWGKNV